jgi:hypothetical protein
MYNKLEISHLFLLLESNHTFLFLHHRFTPIVFFSKIFNECIAYHPLDSFLGFYPSTPKLFCLLLIIFINKPRYFPCPTMLACKNYHLSFVTTKKNIGWLRWMSLEVGAGVSVEVCSIVSMVGMVVRALVATTVKILF